MVHEVALDLQDLWTTCQASLQGQVSEAVWRSTFQDVAALDLEGSVLRLAVPSAVVKDRVETRYLSLVEDIARHAFGEGLTIELAVLPGAAVPATFEDPLDALLGSAPETVSPELSDAALGGVTRAPSPVEDNRLTFEAFVIGPSNRFAHAAALAVAETPGRSYNPLFIYGDAGLGKTHLLHAIRHYVEEMYPDYVVRYVTARSS